MEERSRGLCCVCSPLVADSDPSDESCHDTAPDFSGGTVDLDEVACNAQTPMEVSPDICGGTERHGGVVEIYGTVQERAEGAGNLDARPDHPTSEVLGVIAAEV